MKPTAIFSNGVFDFHPCVSNDSAVENMIGYESVLQVKLLYELYISHN